MKKVLIYTTQDCPYCEAAKRLLTSKNISYEQIDITNRDDLWDKLEKMTSGRKTVPQIFVNGKLIGGYEDLVRFYNSGKSI